MNQIYNIIENTIVRII